MAKRKNRLFVSYSTADKKTAGVICENLSEAYDVFLAHERIEIDEDWRKVILQNLEECDAFIAIVTENFLRSTWTNQEAGFAFQRKIPIISIFYISSNKSGFLESKQGIVVKGKENIDEIINKIQSFLRKELGEETIEREESEKVRLISMLLNEVDYNYKQMEKGFTNLRAYNGGYLDVYSHPLRTTAYRLVLNSQKFHTFSYDCQNELQTYYEYVESLNSTMNQIETRLIMEGVWNRTYEDNRHMYDLLLNYKATIFSTLENEYDES